VAHDPQHNCSLVRILLGTGRSHQIRVQFASRGWPLIGDRRYGGAKGKYGDSEDDQLALLAYRLEFKHPTREEKLEFEIEPPAAEPWNYFMI
jgi:23S rRNA pseudouridine1911/1915/1917 synthase